MKLKKLLILVVLIISFLILFMETNAIASSDTHNGMERTGTYVGHINSKIKTINVHKKGTDTYLSGQVVVVEWVDGKSTVPDQKPIMKFKSTDGEIELEVFVTPTGTNTYYFDRFIGGIDTSKEYYFEISSGNKLNISPNKSMNVYFTETQYNNTVIGHYQTWSVRLLEQKIIFEDSRYIGNINSEIKNIQTIKTYEWAYYIAGKIVIVEWVNGVSTVPEVTPKMKLKSTDGEVSLDMFVTPTGTNTFYFDRIIAGILTDKEYYIEIISSDERNISENKEMTLDFTRTKFNGSIVGLYEYQQMSKKIRVEGKRIIFEGITDTYVGHINSYLRTFNLQKTGDPIYNIGNAYVSGEIIVVEWVDGKSTVPDQKPIMKFKSTDETVELEVFVTATGTNTYYFDRFIEGIDTSKEYYFEISSGNKLNISPNKSMNVYFSNTQYNDTIIGNYHTWNVRLLEQKIIFEDGRYIGNIESGLQKIQTIKINEWAYGISGEIVIVEEENRVKNELQVTPKMKLKSTDGKITLDMFVTPTGTNTYYFDRIIAGIPTDKEYYIEIISNDERNISANKQMILDFVKTEFNDSIIGIYKYKEMSKKIRVKGQSITFED